MRKTWILFLILAATVAAKAQNRTVWIARNADITLFSTAPIEDIDAKSTQAVSALNTQSGDLYFKVLITTFQFKNSMMQDHFNEDFMESDKFPYAEFRGKILDSASLGQHGSFPVHVHGTLTIHNVPKEYNLTGTVQVADGKISVHSKFDVRLSDHHITIPKLIVKNIAEVVQVTVEASYTASGSS